MQQLDSLLQCHRHVLCLLLGTCRGFKNDAEKQRWSNQLSRITKVDQDSKASKGFHQVSLSGTPFVPEPEAFAHTFEQMTGEKLSILLDPLADVSKEHLSR